LWAFGFGLLGLWGSPGGDQAVEFGSGGGAGLFDGVDAEEPALEPLAPDQFVEVRAFFGVDGCLKVVPFGLQEREFFAGISEDELRFGIESGFERVHR
jgi:hypothetical protein